MEHKREDNLSTRYEVGDWVQAREEVTENHFNGAELWIHAHDGAVGHVLEVLEDGEAINVFWERSQTVTICHPCEIIRLCGAEAGRHP